MLLVTFRHGNTFAPGDRVICAGHQDGLPLVAAGWAQAQAAGEALRLAQVRPTALLASPRLRAQQFADALGREVAQGLPTVTESRLDEIDYGPWTGRSREEICATGGAAAVEAWDVHGRWPQSAGFGGEEDAVAAETLACCASWAQGVAAHDVVLAVSHAGRMRYLLHAVPGAFAARREAQALKVRCGHAVVLQAQGQTWRLIGYDVAPAALGDLLGAAGISPDAGGGNLVPLPPGG